MNTSIFEKCTTNPEVMVGNVAFNVLDENENPKGWTIITALNEVVTKVKGSKLSDRFWEMVQSPINYLTKELNLTKMQCVIIALLIESDEQMTWHDMGIRIGLTRLNMLSYQDEMDDLVVKEWVQKETSRHYKGMQTYYGISEDVENALSHNKPFIPEKLDGYGLQELIEKLESHVYKYLNGARAPFSELQRWIIRLCKCNTDIPLCNAVLNSCDDELIQTLIMLNVYDYARFADSDGEGITLSFIDRYFPDGFEVDCMVNSLRQGTHCLITGEVFEHSCQDGIANNTRFVLTRRFKETYLAGYVPSRAECCNNFMPTKELRSHSHIKTKHMFYNPDDQNQIERLTGLLQQDNLAGIQKRLEDEGMRKGFACLFYGAPGTGKTETVLQIARQTGRDILQIDIAGMRDKFVGESEKNIKAVFTRYRLLCRQKEVMPILFFNEADAIFGKRTTFGGNNPSVEKMDNAMQNIILQEIENLEGILIATTNLTCNLDDAFDRRFLFKVEFHKPDVDVKTKLWTSMLGDDISEADAFRLAKCYDFSGGQIENIARQSTIEFILSGKKAGFDEINEFCKHELLTKKKDRSPIGFL